MFANHPASTKTKTRPSNLHDIHPAMKPMNSSICPANLFCCSLVKTSALAVVLASGMASISMASPIVVQQDKLFLGAGSKGNLTNSVLIINTPGAGGSLTTAQIFADVVNGFNGGAWDGLGSLTAGNIYSSNAAGTYPMALGVGDNSLLQYPVFAGRATTLNTEAFVKYTYYGDSDLVGGVTGDDLNLWIDGTNLVGTGWLYGDWDYNGVTNGDDLNLWIDGKNASDIGGPTPPLFADGGGKSSGVVPEPGAIGLLAIGFLGLIGRRRKNN